jgi:putative addiction module component (TIGR02574 family)
MRVVAQLLEEALRLSEQERAVLASALLDSIPPAGADRTSEEWIAEIKRRARAAQAGDPGLSWEEVRSKIEKL